MVFENFLIQRCICTGVFSKHMQPSCMKGRGFRDETNANGDETMLRTSTVGSHRRRIPLLFAEHLQRRE